MSKQKHKKTAWERWAKKHGMPLIDIRAEDFSGMPSTHDLMRLHAALDAAPITLFFDANKDA